jgi:hypothetical protein
MKVLMNSSKDLSSYFNLILSPLKKIGRERERGKREKKKKRK